MDRHRTLRCHDYVNQPYPRVREAILANPHDVFRRATAAAASHAATLHVPVGAIDVGADVTICVLNVEQDYAYKQPATKLMLEWQAVRRPRLFPAMKATLVIFALTPTETQLELEGQYEPPMGKIGEAIDAALGHRLAEASVKQFLQEVASWLREELTQPSGAALAEPGVLEAEQPEVPLDAEC